MGTEQTQLQTTTRADIERPTTKINEFRGLLEQMKPQIKLALPKHVTAERMLRIVLTTVQRTPKLIDCTRESLLGCIVQCAQLGLEPDGLLGHAYLIPFFNSRANGGRGAMECQLIVGYKGLRKLAMQSGEVSSIGARIVHEKDDFEYEYGLEEKLRHVPTDEEDPGKVTHAYAIFRLKDGGHHFDVMTVREINRIRDRSKSYQANKHGSPWSTDFEEMGKKTVFRRASKLAPASIEDKTAKAIELDDRAEAGLPQFLPELPAAAEESAQIEGQPEAEGAATATAADSAPASTPAAKEHVMSTLAQRKNLARGIKEARVTEADVCSWYAKHSFDELSFGESGEALKRLAEMIEAESGAAIK